MLKLYKLFKTKTGFANIFFGSLLMSSIIPDAAVAQPKPDLMRQSPVPTQPIAPPLPEQLQPPSATVIPIAGRLMVKLVNRTGAPITYQAIGDTRERTLPGFANVTLQALKPPATLTFYRQDRGLLRVRPQSSLGILTVTFTAATDLNLDNNVMTIQENGAVFLN